jgi:hypothetical protein
VPVPNFTNYENLVNSTIETERAITDSININGDIDKLIDRNKRALGLTGGANGFFDIDLVKTGAFIDDNIDSNLENRITEREPDGFRLYLICPPKPAISVATAALGSAAAALGETAQSATDLANEVLQSNAAAAASLVVGVGTSALTFGLVDTPSAKDMGKSIAEAGAKTKQIADSIKKYMNDAGQKFDDDFKQYVAKAYNEHPDGNAFYSIVLPMPQELFDSHQHEVDTIMMGLAPRLLSGAIAGISLGGKFGGKLARRERGFSAGRALAGVGLGLAAEAGSYALDTAKIGLGIGLNPNAESVYANPVPRQFQFTFNLPIKSREEATQVRDFIDRLKQHSYPYSVLGLGGQNQVYLYPGEVYFEFSGKFRNNLFRSLRPCIITGINVAYKNASDQYHHFDDGSTIEYVVSVVLIENRLLDRNILVDDAEKYANETLANSQYRKQVKYRDTFGRETAERILTNPTETLRNFGLDSLAEALTPPTPNRPGQL